MRHQLLTIDIDGTLLNDAGELTPRTKTVIERIVQQGHHVILTTGRPDNLSTNYYDELALHSPMINFNGALIHRPHCDWEQEWSQTIPVADALSLINLTDDYAIKLLVAEGKNFTLPNHAYTDVPFLNDMPHPTKLFNADDLHRPPISVTAFVQANQLATLQQNLKTQYPRLAGRIWGAWSGENTEALEIVQGQISKAHAIDYLVHYYQKSANDVWAFGNAGNDLEMLAYAGHGVAMQNADETVKKTADQVTRFDNNHDGLANFLAATFLKD